MPAVSPNNAHRTRDVKMLLVKTTVKPSDIHGLGLFAAEFIGKGTCIWQLTHGFDLVVSREAVEALPEPSQIQMKKYSYVNMETGLFIICMDDARYSNHSDMPNTWEIHHSKDSPERSIALRDILPGEEITCDYRTFDARWREKLGPHWPELPRQRPRRATAA